MNRVLALSVLLLSASAVAAPGPQTDPKTLTAALARAEAYLNAKIDGSGLAPAFAGSLKEAVEAAITRAGCEKASGSLACPGRDSSAIAKAGRELAAISREVDAQVKRYGALSPKQLFEPKSEIVLERIDRLPDGSAKEHFLQLVRKLGRDFRTRVAYEDAVGRLEAIRGEVEGALSYAGSR